MGGASRAAVVKEKFLLSNISAYLRSHGVKDLYSSLDKIEGGEFNGKGSEMQMHSALKIVPTAKMFFVVATNSNHDASLLVSIPPPVGSFRVVLSLENGKQIAQVLVRVGSAGGGGEKGHKVGEHHLEITELVGEVPSSTPLRELQAPPQRPTKETLGSQQKPIHNNLQKRGQILMQDVSQIVQFLMDGKEWRAEINPHHESCLWKHPKYHAIALDHDESGKVIGVKFFGDKSIRQSLLHSILPVAIGKKEGKEFERAPLIPWDYAEDMIRALQPMLIQNRLSHSQLQFGEGKHKHHRLHVDHQHEDAATEWFWHTFGTFQFEECSRLEITTQAGEPIPMFKDEMPVLATVAAWVRNQDQHPCFITAHHGLQGVAGYPLGLGQKAVTVTRRLKDPPQDHIYDICIAKMPEPLELPNNGTITNDLPAHITRDNHVITLTPPLEQNNFPGTFAGKNFFKYGAKTDRKIKLTFKYTNLTGFAVVNSSGNFKINLGFVAQCNAGDSEKGDSGGPWWWENPNGSNPLIGVHYGQLAAYSNDGVSMVQASAGKILVCATRIHAEDLQAYTWV